MGGSLLFGNAGDWTLQLGEYLTITGVAGLVILLFFFTGPFVASAIWAIRSSGSNGTKGPFTGKTEAKAGVTGEETGEVNGFRYNSILKVIEYLKPV